MRIHVASKGNRYERCTHPRVLETEDGIFCEVCGKEIPFLESNTQEEYDLYQEEFEEEPIKLKPDEPPHWMWRLASNGWADHICSRCGFTINTDVHVYVDYKYCPECGVRMVHIRPGKGNNYNY